MNIRKWEFSLATNDRRLEALAEPPPFEHIALDIIKKMEIVCCHQDPCRENEGFKRIIYCIEVDRDLFDLFFNSRNGYRAQYFRSQYEGLRANGIFMQSVEAALVDAPESLDKGMSADLIRESLSSLSAKIWLAECGKHLCDKCAEWKTGPDDRPEILNGRWETAICANRVFGSKAPSLTKLRIFGGFIDQHLNEWIPRTKRHRAREIHECGWS